MLPNSGQIAPDIFSVGRRRWAASWFDAIQQTRIVRLQTATWSLAHADHPTSCTRSKWSSFSTCSLAMIWDSHESPSSFVASTRHCVRRRLISSSTSSIVIRPPGASVAIRMIAAFRSRKFAVQGESSDRANKTLTGFDLATLPTNSCRRWLPRLDRGNSADHWLDWRPSLAICQHEDHRPCRPLGRGRSV
jgi:hypothetical protein